MSASSGGKSRSRQSALTPMPTTTRGSSEPRPSLSPSTPASLRSSIGAARRAAAAGASSSPMSRASGPATSITRSLGHLRWIAPVGSPATSSAASDIASATDPARRHARSGRQPRRPEAERREQRRPGGRRPGPAVSAAARRLLVGDRDADLRARRPRASRGRRRWSSRRWRSARRGRTRTMRRGPRSRRQPAAAPAASTVSGCSSSNAAWSARTASSTRSSAMIVVIRISDVEIISMLMPASASVPNMRAA